MLTAELRPTSIERTDEAAVSWFNTTSLIHGGRIERRRQEPRAGWYVIRDSGSTGPFPNQAAARRWASR